MLYKILRNNFYGHLVGPVCFFQRKKAKKKEDKVINRKKEESRKRRLQEMEAKMSKTKRKKLMKIMERKTKKQSVSYYEFGIAAKQIRKYSSALWKHQQIEVLLQRCTLH